MSMLPCLTLLTQGHFQDQHHSGLGGYVNATASFMTGFPTVSEPALKHCRSGFGDVCVAQIKLNEAESPSLTGLRYRDTGFLLYGTRPAVNWDV